jgi:hypothetical protein
MPCIWTGNTNPFNSDYTAGTSKSLFEEAENENGNSGIVNPKPTPLPTL